LQKDHLLGTLGVMSRAAGNVASESSGKKFGHLHIIFRDWQAVSASGNNGVGSSTTDPAAEAVYRDLFNEERGSDAASRNQIRRDILASFETVEVWLFDPPTETTAALRQKLTFQATTKTFKAQVRALRNVLADQLSTPMITATTTLTAANLGQLVTAIASALNTGEVVLPSDAYINMMQQEVQQHLHKLDEAVAVNARESIAKLEDAFKRQQSDLLAYQRNYQQNPLEQLAAKKLPELSFPSEAQAADIFTTAVNRIIALESRAIYRSVFGEEADSDDCLLHPPAHPLAERLLGSLSAKIGTIRARSLDHFLASYKELLSRVLTVSRGVAEVVTTSTIQVMKNRTEPLVVTDLEQEIESLRQLASNLAGAATYYTESSKTLIDAALHSVISSIDRAVDIILQHNQELINREDELFHNALSQCVTRIEQAMDNFFQGALAQIQRGQVDRVISMLDVENHMNAEYKLIKAAIDKEGFNARTSAGISREFLAYCTVLRESMVQRYAGLVAAAFECIVAQHIPLLREQFAAVESIEVEDEDDFENLLLEQRAGVINAALARAAGWNAEPEVEGELIETPLEVASAPIIEEYLQRYRHAASQAAAQLAAEKEEEDEAPAAKPMAKASSSSLSSGKNKAAEERERARQHAIAMGWITESGKGKKKTTAAAAAKPKKASVPVLSRREDVDAARKKAKEWAQSTLGEKIVDEDENLPWSGNQRASFDPKDYQASKTKIAHARDEAQREIEERSKRAIESIRNDPSIPTTSKRAKSVK
jgi:hypothetical protein